MNQLIWLAIGLACLVIGSRLMFWFLIRAGSTRLDPPVESMPLQASDLDSDLDSGATMGTTGVVPGGVSYLEPELSRAAIELGKKRFGKGR